MAFIALTPHLHFTSSFLLAAVCFLKEAAEKLKPRYNIKAVRMQLSRSPTAFRCPHVVFHHTFDILGIALLEKTSAVP